MVGLGYNPVKVAILALMMNSVPVSFGAVGTPTWFGFSAIDLTEAETLTIAFKSATIHTIVALFIVVMALLQLVSWKSILKNGLYVVLSVAFTVLPYLMVSSFNYEFPALIGGAVGLVASALLAQKKIGLTNSAETNERSDKQEDVTLPELVKATFPLWGTILILVVTRIPQLGIQQLLMTKSPAAHLSLGMLGDFWISPSLFIGLENIFRTSIDWSHKILYVPSFIPFGVISLFTFWIYKSPKQRITSVFSITVNQMQKPTYALLGALVFVNLMMMGGESSAVNTIGNVLAGLAGNNWTFFAAFLGAVGSFFSGSATISNLTFAGIQNSIALEIGLDRTTILALQSVGGAFGNMVCINNIVAVTSVLALANQEGYILKRTALPMLIYGVLAGFIALILF